MEPPSQLEECPFCRIVRGKETARVVYEGDVAVAFLDRRPVFTGHMLLVPRRHVEVLADLPPEVVGPFFADAQLLTRAIEIGLGADGSFVAINNRVSQTVPHLHVHIVPRTRGDGLRGFFWPRHKLEESEAEEALAALRHGIEQAQRG